MIPFNQLLSLHNRTAAITGGARGIGLAIARRFSQAGATVAIGDLDLDSARLAAEGLEGETGNRVLGLSLDVRHADSVGRFAGSIEAELGPVTIWVNNAGIYPICALVEMEEREWDEVHDVNLRGVFLGAREAARRMTRTKQEGRVILNIASVASSLGRGGLSHYTASKHGVLGLTRTLAIEIGHLGVRVLAIAPTLVMTPGIEERRLSGGGDVADFERRVAGALPLGRAAQPDDVAKAALFAVSDMASLVTGTMIYVDAGATA